MSRRSSFPAWLKAHRDKHGLTQQHLADALGCTVGTIRHLEQGRRALTIGVGRVLLQHCGLPVEEVPAYCAWSAGTGPRPASAGTRITRGLRPPGRAVRRWRWPTPVRPPAPPPEPAGRRKVVRPPRHAGTALARPRPSRPPRPGILPRVVVRRPPRSAGLIPAFPPRPRPPRPYPPRRCTVPRPPHLVRSPIPPPAPPIEPAVLPPSGAIPPLLAPTWRQALQHRWRLWILAVRQACLFYQVTSAPAKAAQRAMRGWIAVSGCMCVMWASAPVPEMAVTIAFLMAVGLVMQASPWIQYRVREGVGLLDAVGQITTVSVLGIMSGGAVLSTLGSVLSVLGGHVLLTLFLTLIH